MPTNVENMISGRRVETPDVEARFQALVQSPLRAAILRFLAARPDEAFDLDSLMQTFGRMRLDVENCIRELAGFGLAHRVGGAGSDEIRVRAARHRGRPRSARSLPRAAGDRQPRGSLSRRPALPRNDRPRREDARRVRVDPHRGQVRHLGADPRADRLGQGSRRADDSRAQPPRHQQVPGGQLRRAARHALRIGNLRLRKGRVHRRARSQAGPARAREQRHAVPRRDRRHVAPRPGQAPARARGAAVRAARRQHADRRQFPADFRDQPPTRTVRARLAVPRGSVLPRERVLHPAAVAARARDRHSGPGPAVPGPLLRRQRPAARRQVVLEGGGRPPDAVSLAGQHPRAREHGLARGAVLARPGDSPGRHRVPARQGNAARNLAGADAVARRSRAHPHHPGAREA